MTGAAVTAAWLASRGYTRTRDIPELCDAAVSQHQATVTALCQTRDRADDNTRTAEYWHGLYLEAHAHGRRLERTVAEIVALETPGAAFAARKMARTARAGLAA